MGNEIDLREFGAMAANVATLLTNQQNSREDLIKHQADIRAELATSNRVLFSKLDSISLNGCAMGIRHEKDVVELQLAVKELNEKPSKLVATGAIILSILGGIGGFILWLHNLLSGSKV